MTGQFVSRPQTVETVEELRGLDPDLCPAYIGGKFGFAYRTTSNRAVRDEVLADRLPATVLTPATQPTVHNHGTHDGPGLACREIRLTDGRLIGSCLMPTRTTTSEPTGHEFLPVAGHPDDPECSYRSDGTDATYCGALFDEHHSSEPTEAQVEAAAEAILAEYGADGWYGRSKEEQAVVYARAALEAAAKVGGPLHG